MKNNALKRIGEVNLDNFGRKITIIEYTDCFNIKIRFEDGNITNATYSNFVKGKVRNYFDKTVYGIGYLGKGDYIACIKRKATKQYNAWHNMLKRCYSENFQKNYPTYKGCTVCEEWHNFQVFAKWFDDNYYELEGYVVEIDKDILVKGNKIYSPETCVFTPHFINSLFIKSDASRGTYPIGVTSDIRTHNNKYLAQCCKGDKIISHYVGNYNTPELAFNAYKNYKEQLIKDIADKYKDKIPQKLYDAMYAYEIEITD